MFRFSQILGMSSLLSLVLSSTPGSVADTNTPIDDGNRNSLKPPYNQFDFLIGEWSVDAKTYHLGEIVNETTAVWKAKYSEDKKIIIDEWYNLPKAGENSQYWFTLRTYSDALAHWQIVGLQPNQPTLAPTFLGQWRDNEMHLSGEVVVEQGPLQARVRFYDIEHNSFEWEMKMSIDGKDWHLYQSASARRTD